MSCGAVRRRLSRKTPLVAAALSPASLKCVTRPDILSRLERGSDVIMVRQFVETTVFTKRWNEMGLNDDDLIELQSHIMKNTRAGDVMTGTGGARKIRYALPHKGKSGGARIVYVDIVHKKHIHLLLCYPKGKQEDLTEEQKKIVKQLARTLKGE